ncbi:MAG: hypothetical protein DRI26_04920 [Chloroflexi bacterium]|nr:MAG: hypothetical protein DRI26_04920 [Chloroflexota bacterium]
MNGFPVTRIKQAGYENIVVECPWCGRENIFNRASDLRTFKPIAVLDVSCQNVECGKPFRIVGDSVNERHEMLIFDCYELLKRKQYMNCILTLTQAYEVFFSLFLRVELLYKPFARDGGEDINCLNRLAEMLIKKVERCTFVPMRKLFLQQIIAAPRPANLAEAETLIANLEVPSCEPTDTELERLDDEELVALLKGVKNTTIHKLRNAVVHKRAYRPTREETEAALEETRLLLSRLTNRLGLHDDITLYRKQS